MLARDPTQRRDRHQQVFVVLQVVLVVGAIAGGLWVLHRIGALLVALILAALFAYVIAPLVHMAEHPLGLGARRRLSRGPAIALVYVLLAGAMTGGAMAILPSATEQVGEMVALAPAYTRSIVTWERGWSRYYDRLRLPPAVRRNIDASVIEAGTAAVESGRAAAMDLVGAIADVPWLILIPIFAFFFLKDAAHLRRAALASLPHEVRLRAHRLFEELNTTLAAFVRAQLLACLLVGTLSGIGFAVLGTPYPVLLGVLAGVLEFIPLVGPLLVATVASVVGALHAPILVVWTIGFLGILRLVEDYVIYPRLIRRGIHLHPLAVILSVLVGAELDGVAGMFLAVPAIAIATVGYRHWAGWRNDEAPIQLART
ncbi:MAG TPA: AI-2E family transporter [Vicinamibacterales bacterium]|nr:AI-2E family transporter [Vicinamibacterales bacterium]